MLLRTRGFFGCQSSFAAPPAPAQPPGAGFGGFPPQNWMLLPFQTCRTSLLPFPWISSAGAALPLPTPSPTPGCSWACPSRTLARPRVLPGTPCSCPCPPQGCSRASPPRALAHPRVILGTPSPCPSQGCSRASPPRALAHPRVLPSTPRPRPPPVLPVLGVRGGFTPTPPAPFPGFALKPEDLKSFLPGFPSGHSSGPPALLCSVTSRPSPTSPPARHAAG